MKKNVIQEKSYQFTLNTIAAYRQLIQENKEFILSKQLLRSGTAIGANIEEAIGGQSRKDFISKVSIAYKEARESRYWINLLTDSDILNLTQANKLKSDCDELIRIIGKIQTTTKTRMNEINS